LWDRVTGMFRRSSTYELDGPLVPAVLLVNDETDGVLCDLERVTKYQPFVEQARKNAAIMRQSTRR
jgi:hypothetical protein